MPPRKPQAPLTDEEKFKLQEQQENELGSLQRQYTLLEKDRHQFACGAKLNRLNRVFSIYKREFTNIDADLEVASAPAKKKQDVRDANKIGHLLELHDSCNDEIKKERQFIQEINVQIRIVEKDVIKLRSQQITDTQHVERVWAAISTVDQLMNKLDIQNKKFGMLCAKNQNLKMEINGLLREREVFLKIWYKLLNKLIMGKKFMMDLIEQATIAYDQRQEWCSKLQALRLKAHQDFVLHAQDMRELKRKQDNNKKLEEFFIKKGQKRILKDLIEKNHIKRMEHKIKLKERLNEYRNYLNEILEFTHESNVQVIASYFYKQEYENFGLFNRVINLIKELEFLSSDLDTSQMHIDQERELNKERAEHQETNIKSLENHLITVTKEVENTEEELKQVEQYIKHLLSQIDKLFKICKCNNDPILQLLGDNTTINVYNVSLYLGMIETMVHRAIIDVYYAETQNKVPAAQRIVKDNRVQNDIKTLDQFGLLNPCPLCTENELVSDVIDRTQHVMTREKAREVLAERLHTTDISEKMHNVSACYLPKSRSIIQRRYE